MDITKTESGNFIKHITKKNFTILPNSVFLDSSLDAQAIGYFAYFLSRPEGWNFSEMGIVAARNKNKRAGDPKEGRDKIRTAIKVLEKAGYLYRDTQSRQAKGCFGGAIWHFFERKLTPEEIQVLISDRNKPTKHQAVQQTGNREQTSQLGLGSPQPMLDFPTTAKPTTEYPLSVAPTQYNITTNNINNNYIPPALKERIYTLFEKLDLEMPGWSDIDDDGRKYGLAKMLCEVLDGEYLDKITIDIFVRIDQKKSYLDGIHEKRAYLGKIIDEMQ